MNIGIAAPIEVNSLKHHLSNLNQIDLSLGLGGAAINLLIDGLIQEGHSVIVFTLDPNVAKKYVLEGPKLKIIIGHFRLRSKLKWFDFCRKEYLQIKHFIEQEKENIDLVNAHWSYEFAIGAILSKVPHIISFRDHALSILKLFNYHPYRFFRFLMDAWVRKNGKAFTVNSEYLQKRIRFRKQYEALLIPNPIKISSSSNSRAFPNEKKVIDICFIANGWSKIKNPENAIKGFLKVQKSIDNLHLHLIGKGFDKNSIHFKEWGSKDTSAAISWHGAMPHSELMKLFNKFDILLHTSREESFGNILIEAMVHGIPVIAGKKSGAVPWVLQNGESGILVDVDSINEIANAIRMLATDKNKYESYSHKGLMNVTTRFELSVITQQYIRYFKKVIDAN